MQCVKNNVMVEWVELGEGLQGDYDPQDPEDVELLRFDISKKENGEWTEVLDASYCTRFPTSTSVHQQMKALEYIMALIYEPVSEGHSIKKLCERLSWISPEDIEE
jgi:hypothetical protein